MSEYLPEETPISEDNWEDNCSGNNSEDEDPFYDSHQETARSSYADMLHDTERNDKYHDALKLAIDKMHAMGKKAKVIDIGTGTGLLSMFAAKCGADSIVACEAFSPMGTCAQKIIDLNGFEGKIKVIRKHSHELTVGEGGDLPELANILVTEVFDTELIGEGALSTFAHAQEVLLECDCIVIPSSATIYAQVVESPFAQNWNTFQDVYGEDRQLLVETPPKIKSCAGAPAVHDIQLSQLPVDRFKEITAPKPMLTIDWTSKHLKTHYRGQNVTKVKAERKGKAQVVFMWWDLVMDMDNTIVLSCAPYWAHPLKQVNPNVASADIPWRDHWMQALYYLPQHIEVEKDQEFSLIMSNDLYSLWFHVDLNLAPAKPFLKQVCECGLHCAHSRTFIGQINDVARNKTYLALLQKYIKSDSVVLCVSDGFYLGLAAAKFGAKKILYLDDNHLSTCVLNDFVKHNNLHNIEIVKKVEDLQMNDNIKNVNLVLGLPHFSSSLLPWDGLYFAYLVSQIRDILPQDVVIAPKVFSLKALVVEFKDLHKIKKPLEVCGEFDMCPFDELILDASSKCDKVVEPQPLWEYPCIARSSVVELANFDLETLFSPCNTKVQEVVQAIPLSETPKYNAIALWADWDLEGNGENIISTGPVAEPVIGQVIEWDVHTRQGVHFFDFKNKDCIYARAVFDTNKQEFDFVFC